MRYTSPSPEKSGGYSTSFDLLGWTPGTSDAHNVLHDIIGCRDVPTSSRGDTNYEGYCNKELDALTDRILVETDMTKRDLLIKQAFVLLRDSTSFENRPYPA